MLPATDIAWYAVLPSWMQEQSYMFSWYWVGIIFVNQFGPFVYIALTLAAIVGFRRPYAYPISIIIIAVYWALSDGLRAIFLTVGYYDCRNTFLCRSQTSPYPAPTTGGLNKNPHYVWFWYVSLAKLAIGIAILALLVGLKQLVIKLVPDEEMLGAKVVGAEAPEQVKIQIKKELAEAFGQVKIQIKQEETLEANDQQELEYSSQLDRLMVKKGLIQTKAPSPHGRLAYEIHDLLFMHFEPMDTI